MTHGCDEKGLCTIRAFDSLLSLLEKLIRLHQLMSSLGDVGFQLAGQESLIAHQLSCGDRSGGTRGQARQELEVARLKRKTALHSAQVEAADNPALGDHR